MVADHNRALRRVGEVIQATSTSFVAQCYELFNAPPLGAFVHTGSPPINGVVYRVTTEPFDPNRPILARGEAALSEEDVYRDNPQLARLLTSRFETLIVGHHSQGKFHHFLPPLPPRVHSFVYTCSPEEVLELTSRLDFLYLVVNSGLSVADELVGACLREASVARADPQEFLHQAGKTLATELAGHLPRLNAILRRLTQ